MDGGEVEVGKRSEAIDPGSRRRKDPHAGSKEMAEKLGCAQKDGKILWSNGVPLKKSPCNHPI